MLLKHLCFIFCDIILPVCMFICCMYLCCMCTKEELHYLQSRYQSFVGCVNVCIILQKYLETEAYSVCISLGVRNLDR